VPTTSLMGAMRPLELVHATDWPAAKVNCDLVDVAVLNQVVYCVERSDSRPHDVAAAVQRQVKGTGGDVSASLEAVRIWVLQAEPRP
jgi:hypothetical protein